MSTVVEISFYAARVGYARNMRLPRRLTPPRNDGLFQSISAVSLSKFKIFFRVIVADVFNHLLNEG